MSVQYDIIAAVENVLTIDSTLAAYVKEVSIGNRESVTQYPSLFIEPITSAEEDLFPTSQEIMLTLNVMGLVRSYDKDKQVVGTEYRISESDSNRITENSNTRITEDSIKAAFELENDVKKALSTDRTLGGLVIHMTFPSTEYGRKEYPIRGFELSVLIQYRQNTTTRV